MKVIDSLLNIIEMYINEIKERKVLLNEETVLTISGIFFSTAMGGSKAGSKEEKNKFKNYFDENRLNVLFNLFKYLTSQTLSLIQKKTINFISITICFLLKNEIPLHCGCVLKYVKSLKSQRTFYTVFANDSWSQMIKADECLWNGCPFNEIIVFVNFEVENGVLGLDRDCYLNIVKFLDSSILRKV
jgi:hypothetical protein